MTKTLPRRTRNFYQLMWHLAHYASDAGSKRRECLIEALDRARRAFRPPQVLLQAEEGELALMAAEWSYVWSFEHRGHAGVLDELLLEPREPCVHNACPCPHHIVEHCIIDNVKTGAEEWIGNDCIRWFKCAGAEMDTYGVIGYVKRVRGKDGLLAGMSPETADFFWRSTPSGVFSERDYDFCIATFRCSIRSRRPETQDMRRRINLRLLRHMGYEL